MALFVQKSSIKIDKVGNRFRLNAKQFFLVLKIYLPDQNHLNRHSSKIRLKSTNLVESTFTAFSKNNVMVIVG